MSYTFWNTLPAPPPPLRTALAPKQLALLSSNRRPPSGQHKTCGLAVFAHSTPHSLILGTFGHHGYSFLHQLTVESSLVEPGCPVISIMWSLKLGSVLLYKLQQA